MRAAFALRMFSGKNILNFGIPERLRTLRYAIFTGGRYPFRQSLRLCHLPQGDGNPLSHRYAMPAPPKGELFEVAVKLLIVLIAIFNNTAESTLTFEKK